MAAVVRLLDGLPLAIELAAARITILAPSQLLERLKDRFRLLAGARGAAKRQATLKAAIDWSWDLLTAWEQAALAQCSVFEGGFTSKAAEAVLDLTPWPEAPPTIDAVQALVDKCLLRTWVPVEQGRFDIDEPYFSMYVSIHEYAREKLQASGADNEQHAEVRHGRYFAGFGAEEAIEALFRHGGVKRRRELTLELDNLVKACRRAITRSDRGRHLPPGLGSAGAAGALRPGCRSGRAAARPRRDRCFAARRDTFDPGPETRNQTPIRRGGTRALAYPSAYSRNLSGPTRIAAPVGHARTHAGPPDTSLHMSHLTAFLA